MKLIFKLAWRNILRNKRRSILTIIAIVFSVALSIIQRGLANGTWEYNIKHILEQFVGYIQIQHKGYQQNPNLHLAFEANENFYKIIRNSPGIVGYSSRITTDGLISFKNNSSGVMIIGIDPVSETKVSKLHTRIIEGNFLEEKNTTDIVIGYKLLKNLKAKLNDTVVVLAQGFDGVIGNMKFRISGVVKMNTPEFDASAIIMNLNSAQDLLALENRITALVINVNSLKNVVSVANNLNNELTLNGITNLLALKWEEVVPEIKQTREFDSIGDSIFFFILIVIVSFGILNTVTMSVLERFREIGVSLSIGMRPGLIFIMIILETIMMTLIGVIIGNTIGYFVNSYLEKNPILLTEDYSQIYAEYGFLPVLPSSTDLSIFINISILIILIAIIVALYPAYRAYKLEPLKGIRYT